ncbi:MAG: pseudaminic acid synthase [Alphaproteobacteria bacterium]|nr:pseudaminic acid synthase [Alphaproteobacteria bacterium]
MLLGRRNISVDGRLIGPDHRPYVIAELSGNHNGDLGRAMELMVEAKNAGADAIKLQTYTPDTMTIDCDEEIFHIKGGLWDGRSLHELYGEAQTPWEWHGALFSKGRELGITVFSTPFDESAVAFLEGLGTPIYKVASFEVTDLPLITCIAKTGKPIIISTGMAEIGEIAEAVATVRSNGDSELILLHCVSAYPAPPEEMNLQTIKHLGETFSVVPGLSDHTLGTVTATTGVASGACVIEKHVTLRRSDGGPDAAFSMEPLELAQLVRDTETAWRALGRVAYGPSGSEKENLVFRRSLIVVEEIQAGEPFTGLNLRSIRPGQGLPPKYLPDVLGRRAARQIKRGTPLDWTMVG